MINKGEITNNVKEVEEFLSEEIKKRKKKQDYNVWDAKPNAISSMISRENRKEMNMQDYRKNDGNK